MDLVYNTGVSLQKQKRKGLTASHNPVLVSFVGEGVEGVLSGGNITLGLCTCHLVGFHLDIFVSCLTCCYS